MPKLITTRTRIADLGKPRIIIVGGGFGGPEVANGLRGFKARVVLFDQCNHHIFQPLFRNKVFTFLSWMRNYFSFDRSNRLITCRNEENLSSEEVRPEETKLGVEI